MICANGECNSVWLGHRPLQREIAKAYGRYHTHFKNPLQKPLVSLAKKVIKLIFAPIRLSNEHYRTMRAKTKFMSCKNERGGKLLEIGAGGGRFLKRMQKRGWIVEGVDIDPNLRDKLSKLNIKLHLGDILDLQLSGSSYDAIVMSQTIEHVYRPREVLKEALRLLKPGGKIILTTPNVAGHARNLFGPSWRGWEPPRHLHLFSLDTLSNLLKSSGFTIEEVSSYAGDSAIGYFASKIHQMRAQNSRRITSINAICAYWWACRMEAREFQLLKQDAHAGQGLYAIARKPIAAPLQHVPTPAVLDKAKGCEVDELVN
jgi:SAM-dependent methyltransferase